VPDALTRDTMDRIVVYCGRCLGAVCATIDLHDICCRQLNVENVKCEQTAQYGDLHEFATKNDAFVVRGYGVLYRMFEDEVLRIVVPNTLLKNVIAFRMGRRL
jgi:hypothetical protein